MARQIGLIKIEGTLGDLTFYRQDRDYYVKTKSSLTAEQIANDPNFARTRENNQEFASAVNVSKLVKQALSPHLVKDMYYFAKLNAISYKSVRKDSVNGRGDRLLQEGNEYDFYGYEFGGDIDVFFGTVNETYDRVAGTLDVNFAPFVPAFDILPPPGATYCDFVFAIGECDLQNSEVVSKDSFATSKIDLNDTASNTVPSFQLNVSPNSTHYVVASCTLRFFQLIGGVYYRLYNGDASALVLTSMMP